MFLWKFMSRENCFKSTASFFLIRRISCWKCGNDHKNGSYCLNCNAIQEHSKINYFELLGLNILYDIDSKKLVSNYHKLQIQYHPDKHSNKNEQEKKLTDDFSVLINKAYSTLTDPIERGVYILKLNNIFINNAISDRNPEFLHLMIRYNDQILKLNSNNMSQELEKKILSELHHLSHLASKAFAENNYDCAKDAIIKMKYYSNLLQRIKERSEQFH